MEVLLLPDYTDANPYQRELADALRADGVETTIADGRGALPVLAAARDAGWPDVVHFHWLHPFVLGAGWATTTLKGIRFLAELVVLRFLGVRLVWTAHNLLEHERRAPRLERLFKHLFVRLCEGVFVHCHGGRDALVRTLRLPGRYRSRITVISHGNYIDAYPDPADADGPPVAQQSPNRGEGRVSFVFFGQIRPYKNVVRLIEAFDRLDRSDAELFVVGNPADDEIRDRIETRARGREDVHTVLEFVPEAEVTKYMRLADVVVLPYERIFTSGTAVLAMGYGNPVVAPDTGCVGELLREAGAASAELAYDVERPDGLVAAMRRSLRADLSAIGRDNRALVSRHDWESTARRTRRVYEGDTPPGDATISTPTRG